jgi:hypothetical protein
MATLSTKVPEDMVEELQNDIEEQVTNGPVYAEDARSDGQVLLTGIHVADPEVGIASAMRFVVEMHVYHEDGQYWAQTICAVEENLTLDEYRNEFHVPKVQLEENVRLGSDPSTLFLVAARLKRALHLADSPRIVAEIGRCRDGQVMEYFDKTLASSTENAYRWIREHDRDIPPEDEKTHLLRPMSEWEINLFHKDPS